MAAHDLPLLLISGFGAHRLLEKEAGLHVLEHAGDEKGRSRATLPLVCSRRQGVGPILFSFFLPKFARVHLLRSLQQKERSP
jgi:hypothetical protein